MSMYGSVPILMGVFAVGAVLLAWLLRRRIGAVPHCRKCDYNLTGRDNGKAPCPECGSKLIGAAVVFGARKKPGRIAVAGCILLMLAATGALAFLLGGGTAAALYSKAPFVIILADANRGRERGIAELERRVLAATLSNPQVTEVAETALAAQEDPAERPFAQRWIDILGKLDEAGQLDPTARDRFFRQMYSFDLRLREIVRTGDPLPYQLWWSHFGPDARRTYFMRVRMIRAEFDDEVLVLRDRFSTGWVYGVGIDEHTVIAIDTLNVQPGTYDARFIIEQRLFAFDDYNQPTWTRVTSVSAPVEVRSVEDPDPVKLVSSDGAERTLRDLFGAPGPKKWYPVSPNGPSPLRIRSMNHEAPIASNWGIEVIVRSPRQETIIRRHLLHKDGRLPSMYSMTVPLDEFNTEDALSIIIRASPDGVRRTLDLYEAWDATVSLDPIHVVRDNPKMSCATPLSIGRDD